MTLSREIWSVCCPLLATIFSVSVINAALRKIEFVNNCNQRIWVGSQGSPLPFKGGFQLDAKKSAVKQILGTTKAARFWPRTGCRTKNGKFSCQSGDCGALPNKFGMECNSIGGQPPVTLAEFTFLEGANQHDFYDLSNVDGYNIPMKIKPLGGRKAAVAPLDQFNCGAPKCNMDLNKCPPELKMNKAGTIVCASICAAVNNAKHRSKFPALKTIFNNPKSELWCVVNACVHRIVESATVKTRKVNIVVRLITSLPH